MKSKKKNLIKHISNLLKLKSIFPFKSWREWDYSQRVAYIGTVATIVSVFIFFIDNCSGSKNENAEKVDNKSKTKITFVEEFINLQDDYLTKRGFFIIQKNIEYWNKRKISNNHVALYTLQGDYWSEQNLKLQNILAKKIGFDSFSATIKIDSFNPLEVHQQAGIILMNEDLNPKDLIRMTFCFTTPSPKVTNRYEDNQWIQTVLLKNGKPIEPFIEHIRHPNLNDRKLPKSIELRIDIDAKKNKLTFYYSLDQGALIPIGNPIDYHFEPKYIGLVAFKGASKKNKSKVIPALFDRLTIEAN